MSSALARLGRALAPALLAVAAAVLFAAGVASISGVAADIVLGALFAGSVGTAANIADGLVRMTPLLLAGAGVMLAFRSGIFNIGAEGQLLAGALAGMAVGAAWDPFPGQAVAVLLAGALAGAAWTSLPAVLRIGRGVSEVITTILLNFVALYLVSWAVTGPLQEASRAYPQSDPMPATALLWRLGDDTRLHAGIPLALALVAAAGFVMSRTALGLRLRAAGLNAAAARLAGFPVRRDLAVAFALSGALAGLAGAIELAGVTGRLYERFSAGYGYTAIAVALLGGLRAPGVTAAAFFFAAVAGGASAMERSAGISATLAVAVQGATLLAVALASAPGLLDRLRRGAAEEDSERRAPDGA